MTTKGYQSYIIQLIGVTGPLNPLTSRVAGVIVFFVMNLKEDEMKYPIALKKIMGVENYKVSVPDLPGCECNGVNVDVSLSKIYETIATHLSILAEYGEAIPHATSIEHHLDNYPNVIWGVIDIDITPYLGKSHKVNVTLPELLIKQIDDRVSKSSAYKTRSGFIASACMSELNQSVL